MADAAVEMVRRGHRVIVYAANRGYENPLLKYLPREVAYGKMRAMVEGAKIMRQELSSK